MTQWPSSRLAQRLNHLFATVHPLGRGPYTNEDVVSAIRGQGGDIFKQYIAYLRKGELNSALFSPHSRHFSFAGARVHHARVRL
jgi:hypothetical protein